MKKPSLYYFTLTSLLLLAGENSSAGEVDDRFLMGFYYGDSNTFPARLELTQDHRFAWSLYRDGEYQAKGNWSWDGVKLTLLAVPEGKRLKLEKVPPGAEGSGVHLSGIDVCLNFPGRRYGDYGPGGIEIALENNRKEKIAPSKYKEFSDYVCVQFSFDSSRKQAGGEEGGVPGAVLKEWSHVAMRARGETVWERYPVSYTERKKRRVSFQVVDSNSIPSPFEKAELALSGDVLDLNMSGLSGKYHKIASEKFNVKIEGEYESEWGRLKIHGNREYEWHWSVPCCFTGVIKGRWSEEAGFLVLQGDRGYYRGEYKLLKPKLLKKIGVYPRHLELESDREKAYTVIVADYSGNKNLKRFFMDDWHGYEVDFFGVNGKSLGVAVTSIGAGARIYREDHASKLFRVAIRQFDEGAPWKIVEVPKELRNKSLVVVSPEGDGRLPLQDFKKNIANINPDGSITIRSPILSRGLITYKKIK